MVMSFSPYRGFRGRGYVRVGPRQEGTPNLIIDRLFTATIVVGFIFVLQIFSSSVALASEARARLDSDWETVVKAWMLNCGNR